LKNDRHRLAVLGGEPEVHGRVGDWPPIGSREIDAVTDLLTRGEISYYGREGAVAALEDAFNAYHGTSYALAVSSGTAALHSAFVACGIGPDDEVLAPTYTFLATVTPILATNGIPILIDCEEDTGNIDPKLIEAAVTPRTKAIVVTHLWGHPVEMAPILDVALRYGLKVIEDCSHAHGATYKGRLVGTIGDVGCFSLQGKKIVAAGQGGILITNDQEIYERSVLLGHFRARAEESVSLPHLRPFVDTGFGLNYRMHPLAAALAKAQFVELPQRIALRSERLNRLSSLLSGIPGIEPPVTREHVTRGAFYGYKPRYNQDELLGLPIDAYLKALRAEGVEISRPGSPPLHLSALFSGAEYGIASFTHSLPSSRRSYAPGDLPVSERVHKVSLSLPTFTYEPMELVEEYASAFAKVARNRDQLLDVYESQRREAITEGSAV
jgi:perosamine synthetase